MGIIYCLFLTDSVDTMYFYQSLKDVFNTRYSSIFHWYKIDSKIYSNKQLKCRNWMPYFIIYLCLIKYLTFYKKFYYNIEPGYMKNIFQILWNPELHFVPNWMCVWCWKQPWNLEKGQIRFLILPLVTAIKVIMIKKKLTRI